ncbi:Nitrogen regulatory protein [Boseongicola aestuarii]|jgi:PTS system nitrogen regulatory IIA component|uniref:Nitrogen regulatory protein n=1 Tax=Boseongicola aestuarii TaxID=1470561 RepID=A0A238J2R1_9RHOB|nr:Nitrogen regulatory protein [Boseongicola aestuarii]
MIDLATILRPDAVKALHGVTSKKRLFQEIADVASSISGVELTDICSALQERENLGPTGVGHGIALPHARLAGITSVFGVFIRLEKPLDFDSVDRQPVDLAFALLAPEDAGVEHLKALALVSRTMRDTNVCGKLRANNNPATLHTILTERQNVQAA